ncbi:hypothetical protein BBO99_00002559 [Phytophthora kernoviae]|uniref:Leucine-rich repeat-containing N-terminal plant-type domain-containing protein n=2 Tax=Phytophthora kernoviae TaxID=325452 RepID=A0A3R7G2R4_9STRA|nr:hypothetical protein G195_004317 [Phytophthora kernoviae 00238/432]KAG2527302.1 hypothetical protein JM16_003500 [Phytophthora kernoviae]KAG2530328.1 hypothetical protein JM18_002234 [Phytophthora kernoviae]RLN20924.1 hypothetical protein BBI17_002458 [Phytophthora kernoviae]RLN82868.1 hypothetical protein BBO99_00002559 [Phytophthora kernoviae]
MTQRRIAVLVLLALTWATLATAITQDERGALKLLFWATHGQNWMTKWDVQNKYSDPCLDSWYGIVCDRTGRIRSM